MHNTIIHNLMLLLELGAFGHQNVVDTPCAMSPHKWRKLVDAAAELNILRFVSRGAEILMDNTTVPPTLYETLKARGNGISETPLDTTTAHLFNHWTQRQLENVREEEMNSHNTSDETLILLDHIIKNAEYIITKDTNIEGIVMMGKYIRDNKSRIDYDKLRHWLAQIGLVQIASMEGNMLIACMHFTNEEIPFVIKPFNKAQRLFMNSITKVFEKHSFSTRTRMNVAMLETISHRFFSAISLVTDIEE